MSPADPPAAVAAGPPAAVAAGPPPGRPTVARLSVTPVKGFALHHPHHLDVDRTGAVGNREFLLIDERDRLLSITRTGAFASWSAAFDPGTGALTFVAASGETLTGPVGTAEPVSANFFGERDVAAHVVPGPWSARFSELAGQPVRLARVQEPGTGVDVHPVTLIAGASIEALGAGGDARDLDRRRFRMLIDLDGVPAFAEEGWQQQRAQVGTATLLIGGPVPRCAATTRHPDTGVSDLRTLHLISSLRGRTPNEFGDGLNLGVYAMVETPGRIAVGDAVRVRQVTN